MVVRMRGRPKAGAPHGRSREVMWKFRCAVAMLVLPLLWGWAGEEGHPAQDSGPLRSPSATFRVVSYNIHLGRRLPHILELFRTHPELSRADVIALQEVVCDRRTETPPNEIPTRSSGALHRGSSGRVEHSNQARVLAERLGFTSVCLPGKRKGDRELGLALLSRYPLTEIERIVLPQERRAGDLPRIALGATLVIGTLRIRIYNMHVQALVPRELKIRQVEAVLQSARHQATPYRLILGDLNMLTRRDRRALERVLGEAGFSPALPEPTWTYRRFFLIRMALDGIYVQNLRVLASGVLQDVTASDHRPIWADIALPANAP
jgi:endonuclease/exonuclease/phosphatase family metal-dependent hydrolase